MLSSNHVDGVSDAGSRLALLAVSHTADTSATTTEITATIGCSTTSDAMTPAVAMASATRSDAANPPSP